MAEWKVREFKMVSPCWGEYYLEGELGFYILEVLEEGGGMEDVVGIKCHAVEDPDFIYTILGVKNPSARESSKLIIETRTGTGMFNLEERGHDRIVGYRSTRNYPELRVDFGKGLY